MDTSPISPLKYNASAALLEGTGISAKQLHDMEPELDRIRKEILESDLAIFEGRGAIPEEKRPLDAGFLPLPERLLEEYDRDRTGSRAWTRSCKRQSSCRKRWTELSCWGSVVRIWVLER